MLRRGFKFVHAAVLAFSAVLAFLFVRGLDERGVLGNSAMVWVFDSDDSVSGANVAEAIASFSADRDITVAREVPDLRDPDGRRHLYLASGDLKSGAGKWLAGGYPEFSRNSRTDVHPIDEVGQRDPRGNYYVFGSPEAADKLIAEFSRLGMRASVSHPLSYSELAPIYSGSALLWSFCVVALAAVTMTGASVLLSAKTYGVLRLQGKSLTDLLLYDLRRLLAFWPMAAGTVAAVTIAFLQFYNGLAWFALFASVAGVLAGLLVLLVVVTHAAMISLTCKVEILRAIKGELPARAAMVSVYLIRVPALLLALSVAMNVALAAQDVLTRQENREAYAKEADAVTIRLNGSLPGESKQVITEVGSWLRRADVAGEVIVAGRRDLQSISPESRLPSGEILIVNETFISKQPVLDPSGHRYAQKEKKGKSPDSQVRVIIPESFDNRASAISAAISGVLSPDTDRQIRVTTLRAKNGQRFFGYSPGSQVYSAAHGPKEDRSFVREPVLVVIPNGSNVLTDDGYTAFASQDAVIFPDPDDALNAIEASKVNGLQTYVTAVRPIGQNSAIKLRDAVNELRLQLFNLVLAVAVLLIAGVGVCIIYSRKNAQGIFVRHISGWRYAATHRFILSIEGAVAVVLATRVPFEVWQQNQELKRLAAAGLPLPHPLVQLKVLDLSIVAGLVAIELGAVLIALAIFHGRIVKERATEG
ncbi:MULTISPECIES: hypothetical protein [Streptomyces]|uniref:DUF1430 domain-containing protein n=2 Tax=Streptomyces TaxID=1883 RepID=A0ABV9J760_9ACTN